MSFKKIFIQTKSYLSYQNNSLSIQNSTATTLVCLDDIDTIIVENTQTTLTSSLLSHLAKADIVVVFVDEQFHPSAISIGLYKNSRTPKIQKAQLSTTKPRLNRLWKTIVHAKISHQSHTLNRFCEDHYLASLLPSIVSGDKGNIESVAASYYFKALFDRDFHRQDKTDPRNIALNYGYSIFRSSISRLIVAYGLNPAFGIWHSSELNAFNLSDDLLEPFRPIVDEYVARNIHADTPLLTHKYALVNLLETKVKNQQNNTISLNEALKNIVSTYQSCCLGKREDLDIFTPLPKESK